LGGKVVSKKGQEMNLSEPF